MAKRVGPAYIFMGDPTQTGGAGMTYMGETRGDVRVAPNVNVALGRTDQKGRTPIADGVYVTGPTPIISIPFLDEDKDKLLKVLPGATKTTAGGKTALGFGSGFSQIALSSVPSLAIIPIDEIAQGTNGIDAPNAIWCPAVISTDFGSLVFNLPDGEDIFNPHETQLAALLRESDQASTAIPSEGRVMFYGPPAALSLTWYLPAVS